MPVPPVPGPPNPKYETVVLWAAVLLATAAVIGTTMKLFDRGGEWGADLVPPALLLVVFVTIARQRRAKSP